MCVSVCVSVCVCECEGEGIEELEIPLLLIESLHHLSDFHMKLPSNTSYQ